MNIWFQRCTILVVFVFILRTVANIDYEDEDGKPSWGRCPWIRNKLKNGRVKIRSRGRIAKFQCNSGYDMVGKRFATCVRGQWNNPIPFCVATGCYKLREPANGKVTEMYDGALLVYGCLPGYALAGPMSVFCDGVNWSDSPPICDVAIDSPETFCDFEYPDLCGWCHDPTDSFEWKRNQFTTPSGHVGTGPSYDHTFGKDKAGFYLYLEASSPRKENETCRVFSPVYMPTHSPGCFIFWYHMYGATTGGLRLYVKPESHVFGELTATWEKFGEQGNHWLRGEIEIPSFAENFQIVIEGIRGTGYVGDTAIDDVSLWPSNCSSVPFSSTEAASFISCRGRCRENEQSESCGCTETCIDSNTCCSDYLKICTSASNSSSGEDETPPSFIVTDYLNAITNHQIHGGELQTTVPSIIESSGSTVGIARSSTTPITITSTGMKPSPETTASSTSSSTSVLPVSSSTRSITTGRTTERPTMITVGSKTDTTVTSTSTTTTTTTPATTTTTTTTTTTPASTTTATETTRKPVYWQRVTDSTREFGTSPTTVKTTKPPKTSKSPTQKPGSSTTTQFSMMPTTSSYNETSGGTVVQPILPKTLNRTTEQRVPSTSTETQFVSDESRPDTTISVASAYTANTTQMYLSTTNFTSTLSTPTTISNYVPLRATIPEPKFRHKGRFPPRMPSFLPGHQTSSLPKSPTLTSLPTIPASPSTPKLTTTTTTTSTTTTIKPTTKSTTNDDVLLHAAEKSVTRIPANKFNSHPERTSEEGTYLPPSKPSSESIKESPSTVTAISVAVVLVSLVVFGGAYYLSKRRILLQNKLSDDSEIRFLSDNEIVEFS